MKVTKHIAIIGGGAAGLRAAEVAAAGGADVTVYDAMRAVGRKFIVSGKNGLNLTNTEDFAPLNLGRTDAREKTNLYQQGCRYFREYPRNFHE